MIEQVADISFSIFHPLPLSVDTALLPDKFTYPFHYVPHPLCIKAAEEVQAYLETQKQWQEELNKGKMFGVLIVRTPDHKIGYLAAFSGILAGSNRHAYFVPPIYDVQQPRGFFRQEEEKISRINACIQKLETDPVYLSCRQQLTETRALATEKLTQAKEQLKTAKANRHLRRRDSLPEAELSEMIRESQYQKAEYKRQVRYWQEQITRLENELRTYRFEIEALKTERKKRSATLQQKLFRAFEILNAKGEIKNLSDIFANTVQKTPPAGAGECAAPKLLQYAYLNRLQPLAMAEFWWGNSPKTEIRRHGYYYPACQGKCGPILAHMLQGITVEENPLNRPGPEAAAPEILFEDEWLLIVNKPAGLLSVPGKTNRISVYQIIKQRYPQATGPLIVHRLDMATSGLLLIAKTKEVHKKLQVQFCSRTVIKQYIALLDGIVPSDEGTVDLPLCPDFMHRPQQMVSAERGKTAITRYRVIERRSHHTLIIFYPLTGRTHQLRVHAAHPAGLNAPILGDELYGHKAERLYLHAQRLEFQHPITFKSITVEKKIKF